jgi:5'-nucleotidase
MNTAAAVVVVVRIIGFSDYHSHAVPFRTEGRPDQGGLARVVAYLKRARAGGGALVLSGGDMLNKGVPVWSDEARCIEWPWLDGLVDAMALGNHDLDYGADVFAACRAAVHFPIVSANLRGADGAPYLTTAGKPYAVFEVSGVRIGVFAVAGPDVQRLINKDNLPAGTRWADAIETARSTVKALRDVEKVDAVVSIGHQLTGDDEAMARAVPGIDLILGSHSHLKQELTTVPGTATRMISPFQYLTYVSDLRLTFEGRRLKGIEGGLVRVDASLPSDPEIERRVAEQQKVVVARRPERFTAVGHTRTELSAAGIETGESLIGNWVTETLRAKAGAHVFFTTGSSLRTGLPPGEVTLEDFYAALPYPNRVVTAELSGAQLLDWLRLSVGRRGSDLMSQLSGARYGVKDGAPVDVQVLRDPAAPAKGYAPLDPAARYVVATTDYQAYVVDGYKQIFAAGQNPRRTDIDVHTVLLEALKAGPVDTTLDGRTGGAPR